MAAGDELYRRCGHCGKSTFLGMACDGCGGVFCEECYHGRQHECVYGGKKRVEGGGDGGKGGEGTVAEFLKDPRDVRGTRAIVKGGKVHVKGRKTGVVKKRDSKAKTKLRLQANSSDPKVASRARKALAMLLKSKAIGGEGIGRGDRVVLEVGVEGREGVVEAVFVDKNWTVIKAVDALSRLLQVRNPNSDEKDPAKRLTLSSFSKKCVLEEKKRVGEVVEEGEMVGLGIGEWEF